MDKKIFFIYILQCSNNSFYTGYTVDLTKRYQSHQNGTGSKYTRSFKPNKIEQAWKIYCTKSSAMKIEANLKKLSRAKKQQLIAIPNLLLEFFSAIEFNYELII